MAIFMRDNVFFCYWLYLKQKTIQHLFIHIYPPTCSAKVTATLNRYSTTSQAI